MWSQAPLALQIRELFSEMSPKVNSLLEQTPIKLHHARK
jgi:hypothetical protein